MVSLGQLPNDHRLSPKKVFEGEVSLKVLVLFALIGNFRNNIGYGQQLSNYFHIYKVVVMMRTNLLRLLLRIQNDEWLKHYFSGQYSRG